MLTLAFGLQMRLIAPKEPRIPSLTSFRLALSIIAFAWPPAGTVLPAEKTLPGAQEPH